MSRAGAQLLLCICGLSCLVACVAPASRIEPQAEHTRADCSGCHEREYRAAPHHVDAKPTRCAVCHSETSWQPTQLTHTWTLTGAHAKAECAACHKGWAPQYEHTDRTCSGCHREAFEKAAAAGHVHALVSSNCQDCHTTQAWRPASEPRTKPALLQLSAATASPAQHTSVATGAGAVPVASQPSQRAAAPSGAPTATPASQTTQATAAPLTAQPTQRTVVASPQSMQRTDAAAAAPSATPTGQRAPFSAAATHGVAATEPDAVPAHASEAAATPALGRAAQSPAGKRARRGDNKKRRTPPTAANDAPAVADTLASRHLAARIDSALDARNGAPPATGTKPAANTATPQPTAAHAATPSSASRNARSPEPSASQRPSTDAALRSQPLATAGRSALERPNRSAPQAETPATPNNEVHKQRSATRAAQPPTASTSIRTKTPAAAASPDKSK